MNTYLTTSKHKAIRFFLSILMFLVPISYHSISAQALVVSGGIATFQSDTTIGTKFNVPNSWDKILIKENVTVTGSFYMPTRTSAIEIAGESRETSIIKGDGPHDGNGTKEARQKSAIRCDKSPDVYVHDLRSIDPVKFHIYGGFGNVTVERCDLIETRGEHTTDGIHGGENSVVVRDCYINTHDDAMYVTHCTLVENTTIVHNKNGAPFQVGWNVAPKGHVCTIRNCTVIDNMNPSEGDGNYNQGVVSWAGRSGSGTLDITLNFEGTFTRITNSGKKESHMYQIGRKNTSGFSDSYIYSQGLCPYQNSVVINGNTNSNVIFRNCTNSNDSVPPSIPQNLTLILAGPFSLELSWDEATDDIGVNGYQVYLDDELEQTVFSNTATISNLTCETAYEVKIRAFDGGVNYSGFTDSILTTTSSCVSITQKIEAEMFVDQDGIEIENTSDIGGGENIGYIHNGDWSLYRLNVPETDDYLIQFRVASQENGGSIELFSDGVSKGSVNVPITGGWQDWITVSETFSLEDGNHDIKLQYNGGSGFLMNVNWFQALTGSSSVGNLLSEQQLKVFPNPAENKLYVTTHAKNIFLYSANGQKIDITAEKTKNGFQVYLGALSKGLYILKANNQVIKIVKK